jgi:TolB-like protein/Tfp pilus assembly protein PilF
VPDALHQPHEVFLSYSREDEGAARRICEALRGAGIKVWFDQSELRGGDAWDANIRGQIKNCALFVPIISAHTQARKEGYFRREWKQAVERLEDIAEGVPFVVPVCVDDTPEKNALVPRAFLHVQWTRLGHDAAPDALVRRIQHLLAAKSTPEVTLAAHTGKRGAKVTESGVPPTGGRVKGTEDGARTNRMSATAVIGIALAILVVSLATWRWLPREGGVAGAPHPPAPAKFIAVLAFANLSDDKGNEFFSDGISEELLNVLAKVPGLRVAARSSAFYFKGKNVPIKQVAQELGVTHIVDGSVRKDGSKVRITAELIRASDGIQLWSQRFERELKDIFALQDEIAGLVAKNLQLTLAGSRATKVVNPEAHRLVIEARHLWSLRTDDGFAQANRACTRALQIDPQFAEAHAALADIATVRGWYRQITGENVADDFAQARVAAARAQQLDPLLAEPYASLGGLLYNEGRFAESEENFQRAFELNPNYALAHHWHAHLLTTRGRPDLALGALERSLSLDPLNAVTLGIYALHLEEAGRPGDALAICDRALAIRPDVFLPLQGQRAMALTALGRAAEAVENARVVIRHPTLQPRWWCDSQAIYALRKAGLEEESEKYAALVLSGLPSESSMRGLVLAAMGRVQEAVSHLESTPPPNLARFFYWSMWDPVRNDPRVTALLAKRRFLGEYKLARETLARMGKK